ncbi:amino acid adenylation domain-containing protein [Streptomyces sp. 796.1]|uniref:amino acid adenylation domain-containing protein n=1 Tax=Streptomyces sp. 796.1 TaxID=3163029 RepID=UPI0039C9C4F9
MDLFVSTAARSDDGPAIEAEGRTVSYSQLDGWSDAVCAALRGIGVGRGDYVVLRMPPGAEAIAAMLGILKAGAAYVPLDVRNPPSRNEFILADSGAVAFVGDPDGSTLTGLPVIGEQLVAELGEPESVSGARRSGAPGPDSTAPGPRPDDVAYIIYTSGTTGRPKGVPVRHSSVVALLTAVSGLFTFTSSDRWLLFHSIAFDFSVWEIWGPLSTGARLVVLPHWTTRSPEETLKAVTDRRITVLNQTPTAFGAVAAEALRQGAHLPDLRYVVFGGEKLTPPVLRPWAKRYGLVQPRLVNMYGITETTVHSTFHEYAEADLDEDVSCIGRPLPGFTARVVTEDGREAGVDEPGELWLAGPQVAKGYLNRPELTAERFPRIPASGSGDDAPAPAGAEPGPSWYYRSGDLVSRRKRGDLIYHGRADLQVKLRGHRIELSDIEASVRSYRGVVDAVVWVREFKPGDERLVCAFVAGEESATASPDARALRRHVKEQLPSYMQPASYQRLPSLPRTVNGKVDRAAVVRIWEEQRQENTRDARSTHST